MFTPAAPVAVRFAADTEARVLPLRSVTANAPATEVFPLAVFASPSESVCTSFGLDVLVSAPPEVDVAWVTIFFKEFAVTLMPLAWAVAFFSIKAVVFPVTFAKAIEAPWPPEPPLAPSAVVVTLAVFMAETVNVPLAFKVAPETSVAAELVMMFVANAPSEFGFPPVVSA